MDEHLTLIREWQRSSLTKALQLPLSQKHWAGDTLQWQSVTKSVINGNTKWCHKRLCKLKYLYLAHKPDCLQAGSGKLLSSWTQLGRLSPWTRCSSSPWHRSCPLLLLTTEGGAVCLVVEALWLPQFCRWGKDRNGVETENQTFVHLTDLHCQLFVLGQCFLTDSSWGERWGENCTWWPVLAQYHLANKKRRIFFFLNCTWWHNSIFSENCTWWHNSKAEDCDVSSDWYRACSPAFSGEILNLSLWKYNISFNGNPQLIFVQIQYFYQWKSSTNLCSCSQPCWLPTSSSPLPPMLPVVFSAQYKFLRPKQSELL